MSSFSLCTATREKEYFFFPGENPALEERGKVWRSLVSDVPSLGLVSRRGEVTFSAGPFKSGREDRYGRPIANSVIVRTAAPEEKERIGRIFSAIFASVEARRDFAEQLEAQAVQRVLKGEAWDGQLPELTGVSVSSVELPAPATQYVYPADSPDTLAWAGRVSALLGSGRDFAIGCSVFSGGEVARKLHSVYKFGFDDWSSTFIAVFSAAASYPAPLRCPAPPANVRTTQKNGSGGVWLAVFAAGALMLGAVTTCAKLGQKATQPGADSQKVKQGAEKEHYDSQNKTVPQAKDPEK